MKKRNVIPMRAKRAGDLLLARANGVTQKQVLRPLRGHQDDISSGRCAAIRMTNMFDDHI
jgi:hypothetical protein